VIARSDSVSGKDIEFSIVMPCLNEAETVDTCVRKARTYLHRAGISGEVIVADNGSTDGSQALAEAAGARVVEIEDKGYGNALLGGFRAARGTYIIMGDADDSYDFSNLDNFVIQLRAGHDLVMGNRFRGGIRRGAMPWLHRYLGNPVLSGVGKLFFAAPVGDFHCGLRGFRRERLLSLDLLTTGMEFASEIVVKCCLAKYSITEVPTTLDPDGRSRRPHLRSWRDGWRHLRFLLIYSPRWLFLLPGFVALIIGLVGAAALLVSPITVGTVTFDVGTMVYFCALAIIGYQSILFAILTKVYGESEGFLPAGELFGRIRKHLSVEGGIILGAALFGLGILIAVLSIFRWGSVGFGQLDASQVLRTIMPAVVGLVLGYQTLLSSMFIGILGVRTRRRDESAVTPQHQETSSLLA
jgi:Glycosyl transferase family 2